LTAAGTARRWSGSRAAYIVASFTAPRRPQFTPARRSSSRPARRSGFGTRALAVQLSQRTL